MTPVGAALAGRFAWFHAKRDRSSATGAGVDRQRNRIHQLDAIRGLLAIGVMVYHVVRWTTGADIDVLGTWGVYAFFILSGFALDHVYRSSFALRRFAIARVARLAPLWVPVVLISAIAYGMTDPSRVALNLTGLFGIVHPGATSIATGGWSIGIEVACYALFPLLVRLSTRSLVALTVATLALRIAYVAAVWPAGARLDDVWVPYTELPSFLVFFVAGMAWSRFGFPGPEWRGGAAQVATALGDLSYGTYLLHPLVWLVAGPWTLVLAPALALASRRFYEIPVGRVIRRLALRAEVREHGRRLDPGVGGVTDVQRPA